MQIDLRPYVRFRTEPFGGLVSNTRGRIFFVVPEVIRALETQTAPADLYQFLAQNEVVRADASCEPVRFDESKFMLDEIEIPAGMEYLSSPLALSLFVTRGCNLHCPHCATDGGIPAGSELTEAELHDLLDQAHAAGLFSLSISGGEPLTRPDLIPLLARADALGLPVTLLTNGLLLDEATLGRIPGNVFFLVSLDGLDEEYDYFRGRNNHTVIMQTIRLLQAAGREFALTCMFTKKNKAQTRKVLERFLLAEGVPVIPTPVLPFGRARNREELLLTEADVDDFVALKRMKRDYYAQRQPHRVPQYSTPSFGIDDMTEVMESAFWACSGTRLDLAVSANGTVFPCISCLCTDTFPLGSIREMTLQEVWHSCSETDRFRQITWHDFHRCSGCDIAEYCNFRCPAISLAVHGDPLVCGADAFTRETIRRGARQRLSDPLR